jgi:molybdopterin-guanine dinucleotide biosynthesis protein A
MTIVGYTEAAAAIRGRSRVRKSGIILCGGKSSRMGRPKALLPWRDRTLIETVVETLHSVVDDVVVVSSEALELPPLDARVVHDRTPGLGPLAGIREGLHAIGSGLAFVASTDAPHLSPRFVSSMFSYGSAAALELDGHVQTLCGVYDADRCAVADELIARNQMRPLFLLEASQYRRVAKDEVEEAESIRGFNRPEEYLAALRMNGPRSPAALEFFGHARRRAARARIDVPIGTLAEVLKHAEPALVICRGNEMAREYLISLNGRDFVRNPGIPIGPGDRVLVIDSGVGG